jgi:phosphatidylglycerophosphate synthase|tara:strand:- start:9811 stop:10503 length:693 start_codon:yes stop_codon:yes gene_type:complete
LKKYSKENKSVSLIEIENEFADEFFFKYFYRHISLPVLNIFLKMPWSPLQITILSIMAGMVATLSFFGGNYIYLLIGVFFLNLSLILDKVDGQVARLRNLTSIFGGWLDSLGHIILFDFYFLSLAIGNYYRTGNAVILIFGILCLFHISLAIYIIDTSVKLKRKTINGSESEKEISLGESYFGLCSFIHVYLTVGCLFNQVFWTLCFFSIAGIYTWVKPLIRRFRDCERI